MEQNIKIKRSALLIMDVQGATVNRLNDPSVYLQSVNNAIKIARKKNIRVIYIVVGFRKGYPEASENNKSFSQIKNGSMSLDTPEATKVNESVAPGPDDIIITKKRVSAFTGSDLEVVLRSLDINHIILTGISTSGVVLSTLREAADRDYIITVLSDCCADPDEEIQHVLIDRIFPRQAEVTDTSKWNSSL